MTFVYPVLQILVFLALLFAPPEEKRITISGPDLDVVLEHDGKNWRTTHEGHAAEMSLAGSELVARLAGGETRFPLAEYVGAALRHDWKTSAKLTLHDQTTLEKSPDGAGYVLRVGDGTPEEKRYVIRYASAAKLAPATPDAPSATATIRINVLGAVNAPGTYALPADATLLDALKAAGGLSRLATPSRVSLIRGPAGEKPVSYQFNVNKMIRENLPAPSLQDGDTIIAPEIYF